MKTLYEKNSNCIVSIEEMLLCYRRQNYHKGNLLEKEVLEKLSVLMDALSRLGAITDNVLSELLTPLFSAKKNQDYILLADIYELQIVPFLINLQNLLRENISEEAGYWEQNIASLKNEVLKQQLLAEIEIGIGLKYSIEDTNVGGKTLRMSNKERTWYLHSNGNPWIEGAAFAEEYYDVEVSDYSILGFGLGYHVEQLWKKNRNIKLTVYETDLKVLQLAMQYCDLKELLLSEKINIVYDPDLEHMGEGLKNLKGKFLVYAPVLGYIKNQEKKESIEEYFMHLSSIKNQGQLLRENFNQNKEKFALFVDELKKEWENKEIVLVAGGPSLDEDMGTIKKLCKGYIIVAVGTVLKKLLEENIKPDYVIITDAKESMKAQIENVDALEIPLLYLSTVSPEVLKYWKGRKYCILQQGFEPAEKYANTRNLEIYETGGSVSTTALELAIRLGQKKVYCFGLDLAYTGKKTHATGTLGYTEADVSGMRQVKAVDGSNVYTIKNLDSYRHWIERRIKREKNVEFINISRGAYITGMKNQVSLE